MTRKNVPRVCTLRNVSLQLQFRVSHPLPTCAERASAVARRRLRSRLWLRLGIRRRRAVRGSAIVGCRPIGDERPPAGSACAPVGRRSRAATLQGRRTVSGSSCSPATQQRTDWQGVEVWSGGMRACGAALGSLGCPNGRRARASRLGGAGSRGDPRLQAGGQRAGDGWPDLCSFWTSARASKVQCDRPA